MNAESGPPFEGEPLPDLRLAEGFLDWLAPGSESFTFYTFDDDKIRNDRTLAKYLHGTLAEHAAELERLNRAGAAVCVVAHVTDGRGRKSENVTDFRGVHWADIERPYDPKWAEYAQPHAVLISSDQGFYPLWKFEDNPPSASEWETTQDDLQEAYGSDKANTPIKGPRLPGFWHRKRCAAKDGRGPRDGQPRMVRFEVLRPETTGRSAFAKDTAKQATDMRAYLADREKEQSSARQEMGEKHEPNEKEARELLTFISADDYSTWINVGMALKSEFGEDGFDIWDEWSQNGGNYTENGTRERWPGFGDKVKYQSLCWLAKKGGGDLAAIARKHGKARDTGKSTTIPRDLALRSLDDIGPSLTANYLIKGFLGRNELSVLYAAPGSKKTFLALDLALHVATGAEWFGMRTAKDAGAVIFIAAEGGSGLDNRVSAFRKKYPDIAAQARGRFFLYPGVVDLGPGGVGAEEMVAAIKKVVAGPVAMIVIDTLARTMGVGDENKQSDMGMFIKSADMMREATGAHVMIIHHSGKDVSKGARGSSALRGAADTEIELMPDPDVQGLVIIKNTKQRDLASGRELAFMLDDVALGIDEDGDTVKSAVVVRYDMSRRPPASVKLSKQHQLALDVLSGLQADEGGWSSMSDWDEACEDAGLSTADTRDSRRKAFNRAVAGLRQAGKVEQKGDKARIVRTPDDDCI